MKYYADLLYYIGSEFSRRRTAFKGHITNYLDDPELLQLEGEYTLVHKQQLLGIVFEVGGAFEVYPLGPAESFITAKVVPHVKQRRSYN